MKHRLSPVHPAGCSSSVFSERKLERRPAALRHAVARPCEPLEGRTLFAVGLDANGWTVVTPSADTRTIYISTSGSDANDGLSTHSPVATVTKARSLVRGGFPDQILFRRGDTFFGTTITNWNLSGRNAQEPFVIGAYTDPAAPSSTRPKLATGIATGFAGTNSPTAPVSHVYIMGVAFEAHLRNYRNPPANFNPAHRTDAQGGTYGVNVLGTFTNLLVEDCSFQYYRTTIALQNGNGTVADVRIRRNLVLDSYSQNVDKFGIVLGPESNAQSEGLYAQGVQNLTLDGNVFDHNGWADSNAIGSVASIYNHNIYLNTENTGVQVINNVIADAGSHGLQARSGGIVRNNLFLRNPIGMSFGYLNGTGKVGGVSGDISDNVFLEDRDIFGAARGWSIEIANLKPASAGGGTTIRNNIFAADSQRAAASIKLDMPTANNPGQQVGINDLTIESNLIYAWQRGIYVNPNYVVGGTGITALRNLTIRNNDIQRQYGGALIDHHPAINPAWETFSGNRYDSAAAETTSLKWFKVQNVQIAASAWKQQYEPTAVFSQGLFPDPTRGVAQYNAAIGAAGGASTEAFLAEMRRQSRSFWRPQYTTDPVIDYVRTGFSGGRIDTAGPTSSATATNVTIAGAATHTVTVTWSDDNKLDLSTLGNDDVRVVGPNGFSAAATLVSSTGPNDGSKRTATYTFAAPDGQWTAAANGLYSVVVQAGAVKDVTGKSAASGDAIGTFSVSIDPAVPSAVGVGGVIVNDTAPATVTVTYTGGVGPGVPTSVSPANFGFETPNVGADFWDAYASAPAGAGWNFTVWDGIGQSGVAGNNAGFTAGNPASPQGAQVGVIQGTGAISQTISDWQAGTYTISFQAAQRGNIQYAPQTLQVLVDGQFIASFVPASTHYELHTSPSFAVPAGAHTISIVGTDPASAWAVALIDDVQIIGVTESAPQTLSASTLDADDIRLTGANGFSAAATSAVPDLADDGVTRIVTYTIPAPAGGWSSVAAKGQFAVHTVAGQVLTTTGVSVPAGRVGTLTTAIHAPTASVQAGNVTAGSTNAHLFAVTYLDNAPGLAASIDANDVRVTGPGGWNQPVSLVSTNDGAGTAASPLVVTYSVAAPVGGWSSAGNGLYWVTAQPNQVVDADGNALAPGAIGSFSVAIDVTAPLAWVSTSDVTNPTALGGTPATKSLGISYYDVSGVNPATLDAADVRVVGPNGYDQPVTVSFIGNGVTASFANYVLAPPAGGWKSSHNGTYSVVLQAGQVADNAGNAITTARTLTTFNVTLETVAPTVSVAGVTPNPRNSAVSSLSFTFNETVTGVDLADLSLSRSGSPVPLAGAVLSTSDNKTWTLTNLNGLTASSGAYALSVNAAGSGIVDLAGNAFAVSGSTTWSVDTTPPTVSIDPVTPETRSGPVDAMTVRFSEPVTGFDPSDLTLKRNGEAVALTGVTLAGGGTTFVVNGLTSLTAAPGSYVLTVRAAGTGIADVAGNALVSPATTGFTVTAPPVVKVNDGSIQRSMVTSLTVSFQVAAASWDAEAFELTRTPPDGGPASTVAITATPASDHLGIVLTFAGADIVGGSLADGTYTLVVRPGLIRDAAGSALPHVNQVATFHRLFGDVDGDRDVDGTDSRGFRTTLGAEPGSPLYDSSFDADSDGDVDGTDSRAFRTRLGTAV